jgi:hypothetical protein
MTRKGSQVRVLYGPPIPIPIAEPAVGSNSQLSTLDRRGSSDRRDRLPGHVLCSEQMGRVPDAPSGEIQTVVCSRRRRCDCLEVEQVEPGLAAGHAQHERNVPRLRGDRFLPEAETSKRSLVAVRRPVDHDTTRRGDRRRWQRGATLPVVPVRPGVQPRSDRGTQLEVAGSFSTEQHQGPTAANGWRRRGRCQGYDRTTTSTTQAHRPPRPNSPWSCRW